MKVITLSLTDSRALPHPVPTLIRVATTLPMALFSPAWKITQADSRHNTRRRRQDRISLDRLWVANLLSDSSIQYQNLPPVNTGLCI